MSGSWAPQVFAHHPLPAYLISFSSRMSMFSVSSWQANPMFIAVSANQPFSAPLQTDLLIVVTLPARPWPG
jgi:hypothetical protein